MEQLYIQIINNSITVSVLILVVIAIRFLFRKMPKWSVCLLWAVVGLRLVLPFQVESIFSLIPSGEPVPVTIGLEQHPHVELGIATIDKRVNPIMDKSFGTNPEDGSSVNPIQVYLWLACCVWAIGMAVMALYGVITFVTMKRKVRMSVPLYNKIYECEAIDTPFILGIVRPRIYLPCGLSDQALESILKHEKTHLKRRDYLWKPLGFLTLAIYWFNPLCWVAYILLCRDIEYACDEQATRGEDEEWRANYCQVLLNCSVSRRMISACPVAFGEVGVKARVKSVLNYKKPTFWILLMSLIAVIGVGVCLGTNPKKERSADVAQNNKKELDVANSTNMQGGNDVTSIEKTTEEHKHVTFPEWLEEFEDYRFDTEAKMYEGKGESVSYEEVPFDASVPLMLCQDCRAVAAKLRKDIVMITPFQGTADDIYNLLDMMKQEAYYSEDEYTVGSDGYWYESELTLLFGKEDDSYSIMNIHLYSDNTVCVGVMDDASKMDTETTFFMKSKELADLVKSMMAIEDYDITECDGLTDVKAVDANGVSYSLSDEDMEKLRTVLKRTQDKGYDCGGPYDVVLTGEDNGRDIQMVLANDSCPLIIIESVGYRMSEEDGKALYEMLGNQGLEVNY